MMKWELLPDKLDQGVWDGMLAGSADCNVFQSYKWGEYKKGSGWVPERWIARSNNGDVICMAQILFKAYKGFFKLGWAPGGPVILFNKADRRHPSKVVNLLLEKLSESSLGLFVRFNSQLPNDPNIAYSVNQACKRPFVRINSAFSIHFDLNMTIKDIFKQMRLRQKSYMKQALSIDIEWKAGMDDELVNDLTTLFEQMRLRKHLKLRSGSADNVKEMALSLKNNCFIFTGYYNREPVSSCLILTFEKKAFYITAATGDKGLEIRSSYAMIYRLIDYLKGLGFNFFDFGGIDPLSLSADGVNQFKRGFGGNLVESLGEWEWASSEWLRWAVNVAIKWKRELL